jgi:hypothetical protein
MSFDSSYNRNYNWAVLTQFGIGLVAILDAGRVLLRVWKTEAAPGIPSFPVRLWNQWSQRYDALCSRITAQPKVIRARLERNPFFWLAVREGGSGGLCTGLMIVSAVLFGFFLWVWMHERSYMWFLFTVFLLLATHLLLKTLIAIEASRRFFMDRESGAMELLLSTPLTEGQVLKGFVMGMRQKFLPHLILLSLMNLAAFLVLAFGDFGFRISADERHPFCLFFLCAIPMLWVDFHALIWTGMLRGIRARKHFKAVLAMLGVILIPPWVFVFFLAALQVSGNTDTPSIVGFFWFLCSGILSLGARRHARKRLESSLRLMASGLKPRG